MVMLRPSVGSTAPRTCLMSRGSRVNDSFLILMGPPPPPPPLGAWHARASAGLSFVVPQCVTSVQVLFPQVTRFHAVQVHCSAQLIAPIRERFCVEVCRFLKLA